VKSGGPSVGKVRECDMTSQHLQGYSPRLYRLRTDGLSLMSKYWMYRSHAGDMSLVSLVACHQQIFGLSLPLQWLCWERNWGGSHGPLSRVERWSREHFFSRTIVSEQCYWWLTKGCYIRTTWDMYGQGPYAYRDWNACGVDMSTAIGCTSIQIVMTLEYEYRLFLAVST
jgi:hypothetical protein